MVGAALALSLARAGFDVVVIEPRAPAPWHGDDDVDLRVVALAPSSIDLFGRLGVWTSIAAARACPYHCMRVWDALAPGELGFEAADQGVGALGHIVENRLIQHALWRALESDPRIALRCPARVASTEAGDDRRTLVLDDESRVVARLVIAADGGESALREMAGIGTQDRDYGQRAIVAHNASCRGRRLRSCQCPTGARRLCGRLRKRKPRACSPSTIARSAPNSAPHSITASALFARPPLARDLRCA
jgi:2-octaprenyl-3-methyl-6-methoxy-1,4-benzoquinol hydroxylase/2-octaprenylphenol hydroxylase